MTAGAEDALAMGLVVGEERSAAARGVERALPQPVENRNVAEGFHGGVVADQAQRVRGGGAKADARLRAGRRRPAPGVAVPQMRQDVQGRGRWAAIEGFDADGDVFLVDLGVLDDDVEVAVLVEDARIEQLVLGALAAAAAVFLRQQAVGKLGLRIFVEELHVRVGRGVVEVEVVLLDVLAVVALDGRDAEQPLFQDGVVAVPEGGGEDEELIAVAESRRCRPRPSGTPCSAPGRAAGSPRHCRRSL